MELKCKFGEPTHGWLPFSLSANEFQFEADVSDVPANPVDALVQGLGRAIDGLEAEVWLHLEPASYYLRFMPLAADKFRFYIEFSEQDTQVRHLRTSIFESDGNKSEIILPFWRALKIFESHSYSEPAWPECDATGIAKLTKRIKDK